jgi:hypothetical protein
MGASVSCVPCGKGSHQPITGQNACVSCVGGEYQDESGATTCKACRSGNFCTAGASEEAPCPQGTFCGDNATLPTSLTVGYYAVDINGVYTVAGGTDQVLCPEGWYCSGGIKTNCTTLGTYCPAQSTEPLVCPAGSYCSSTAEVEECAAGQYCAESATVPPRPCAAGHYCATPASEEGCEACTFCGEGSVLPTGVSVGHYSVDAAGDPATLLAEAELPCPAGSYCSGGIKTPCTTLGAYCPAQSTEPLVCPAGSYCSSTAEVEECAAGQYCAESATVPPRPCAAGHYCATPASEEGCEAGTFCGEGSVLPTGVSVGHYSVDAAGDPATWLAEAELPCPAGSYCSDGNKTDCLNLGEYCEEQSTEPVVCPAGSYCPSTAEVEECAAGQYCAESATVPPRPCAAGHYCATPASEEGCEAGTFCGEGSVLPTGVSVGHYAVDGAGDPATLLAEAETPCPAGSYCSRGDITACDEGSYCPQGSSSPSPCLRGTYQNQPGQDTCLNCEAATFQNTEGNTACITCTSGRYCPESGLSNPLPCPKGNFCAANATLPTACVPGTDYCPELSAAPLNCPEDATCTVPASPELIIGHNAILEKRESEVASAANQMGTIVGSISYTLRLSVEPKDIVEVRVSKDAESNVDCVLHGDGLFLNNDTHFFFDNSNWDQDQTVHIDVWRNATTFQGSSVTRFVHTVESEDPDWRSPFLRPLTLTIADDDECTEGAVKYDDIVRSMNGDEYTVRKCGCQEGFYIEEYDPAYCDSVTRCSLCRPGMICSGRETIQEILMEPGFFRIGASSIDVVDCPVASACNSTAVRTFGDSLCDQQIGHEGLATPPPPPRVPAVEVHVPPIFNLLPLRISPRWLNPYTFYISSVIIPPRDSFH